MVPDEMAANVPDVLLLIVKLNALCVWTDWVKALMVIALPT
jgi:hypothetical protein